MASATILDWTVATAYTEDEVVTVLAAEGPQYTNKLYRCESNHTSISFTTDFGNGLWEEIVIRGEKGNQGDQGVAGPTGATGATGPAGSNGIITDLATQAEAEAGVDGAKGMTPIRTKQAIDYNLTSDRADIAQNQTDIATNAADIATNAADIATNAADIAAISIDSAQITTNKNNIDTISQKVTVLENATEISVSTGQQRINNNQAVAEDILGGDAGLSEGGYGDRLELNPVGAKSAKIRVEMFREDDAETRFTVAELELHYVSGTWYLGRSRTLVLIGGDDGVTFGVTQDVNDVATVNYTSDNMTGGNYKATSYLKFELKEISNF